jgi:predicted dehydrogenase
MNRRSFLRGSAAGVMGTFAQRGSSQGRVLGANQRIRCGFIGVGNMGRGNLRDFLKCENAEVVAVCDVWQPYLDRAVEISSAKPAAYSDFRRVLDRKDVDVVIISTPDHWHGYMTIEACKAGKDVYVEKPLAHNISEGRKMVESARKHNRVVQCGTQQRSARHYHEVVEFIKAGKLGKVNRVAAWNYQNESPFGMGDFPDTEPPPGLDYNLWLGPAPKRSFNPNRFIFNFRYFWDYAGGYATDWGVHHIDTVQWVMNVQAPTKVSALGGKYDIGDNRETPDTLEVIYEYPTFLLSYSNRLLNANPLHNRSYGVAFYGTDATLVVDRSGYDVLPETQGTFEKMEPFYKRDLEAAKTGKSPYPWGSERDVWLGRTATVRGEGGPEMHLAHVKNFLDCVANRKKPASDVEVTHYSTATTHLANISYQTGRTIRWDSQQEQIVDDVEAAKLLRRDGRAPWIVT